MIVTQPSDLWYKNAIIYCIDVGAFLDSDGDGMGDFNGLTSKLDYLGGLGVTCLWLMPFYPSPQLDGGYDVVDYYGVDSRLGSLGDFVEFTRAASERGIRVIVDLVVQHTSDQHPWFKAARASRESPYHQFYVWNDDPPPHRQDDLVFPGEQDALWTYEPKLGSYYRHRFYEHQPDLNTLNPAVLNEIAKVIGFWLTLGVSGFRLDAAPFLIDMTGIKQPPDANPYALLHELRRVASWRKGDAVFLAEANVLPIEAPMYFEHGHGMHMLINFWLNQHLFLALARGAAEPLSRAIAALPDLPAQSAWANFLRNHDELDLGRLAPAERDEIYARFAPDRTMRIYNRGIRRRLAPMLQDQKRLELALSMLFSLPGTPVLFYGDELGMGEDLALPARHAVRTAMQWADQPNAGFSTAAPDRLQRTVITSGSYGYPEINVARLEREPNSLLNRTERLIRARKQCPEFGWGDLQLLETNNHSVLAYMCSWQDSQVIAVHNFSGIAAEATIHFGSQESAPLTELVQDADYKPADSSDRIVLGPYGYRWFRFGTSRPLAPGRS
jgi:maltose alpha-D-glucosyltransferase / alpha-amylase